ncbi:MAG: ATP-dependent DNA helicase [Acidimicrobiales bacterium]
MRSFDPDEDPVVDPSEDGVQLREDLVVDQAQRALALLERITRDLPGGGEERPGQRVMTERVAGAFARRRPLVVEAGTGIGKSLAYLIPAALSGERVVVATATRNLQDQLATKDAPLVAAHVAGTRVAVLKGRQNYLCRQRAQVAGGGGQLSFDDGAPAPRGVAQQIRRILRWSQDTDTGDRDDLDFEVDPRAWRALSVTPQECVGRAQCPQGGSCFAELARDRANESTLLIVNTHLYAAHLASGAMLLPAHELAVFDEAHDVPEIMASLLGTSLSTTRLRALATSARALLGADAAPRTGELATSADRLTVALENQYERDDLRGLDDGVVQELSRTREVVTDLVERLRALAGEASSAEERARRARALGPAVHLHNDLLRLDDVGDDELVFLVRREREVEIELSLIDVGPRLAADLWPHVTGVLTSATIPDPLPARLGLGDHDLISVESPFDYHHQALLYVPERFPARNAPTAEPAIIEELTDLIRAAGGRTLALFTNRSVMNRVAEAIAPALATPLLVQGSLSRARLIEQFRDDPAASLFAVTSFWQGVDVPGHSLSLVTIDRLPFAVPHDPLAEARRERAARPFYDVDLPRATMLLAQGVGRLIRGADDRGVVAVLDTRLAEAGYRGALFRKLPPMARTRDRARVEAFLRALASERP